ncbi:TetR family transcriptional regulator [Chryseobacterium arthrosphaerae]|nr:TetR family transcriptional regulator [Chryseobacterium arthrosphaerae]WES99893.1 TetR family transcriptional regulator [Chryseobacterium arthrosphaerae]
METKEKIVTEAITFITTRGTNAFSYKDISKEIGIKTSSIHYYFPTKNDLIVAVLEHVIQKNKEDRKRNNYSNMKLALKGYIDEHILIREQNKVSIIAALAADINTLEPQIKAILNNYIEEEIDYLAYILNKGEEENLFVYKATPRIQALMILTNLLAISRISMITKEIYFEDVARQIIIDIEKK